LAPHESELGISATIGGVAQWYQVVNPLLFNGSQVVSQRAQIGSPAAASQPSLSITYTSSFFDYAAVGSEVGTVEAAQVQLPYDAQSGTALWQSTGPTWAGEVAVSPSRGPILIAWSQRRYPTGLYPTTVNDAYTYVDVAYDCSSNGCSAARVPATALKSPIAACGQSGVACALFNVPSGSRVVDVATDIDLYTFSSGYQHGVRGDGGAYPWHP
jgi:hypothetical protein